LIFISCISYSWSLKVLIVEFTFLDLWRYCGVCICFLNLISLDL
jgi:hypothetical protein